MDNLVDPLEKLEKNQLLTSADLLSVIVYYLRLDDVLKLSNSCKQLRSIIFENSGPLNQSIWTHLYKVEFYYEPKAFPDVALDEDSRIVDIFKTSF